MSKRKILIIVIIAVNLLFVWSVFNMFYYKKASFDSSKKAQLDQSSVDKITNGDGQWNWNGIEYDFYKDYSFVLINNEIIEFCEIINASNAKYIENIRPKMWFDIYIEGKNGKRTVITLKLSDKDEIYFDMNHKTYEGSELEKYMQRHLKQN